MPLRRRNSLLLCCLLLACCQKTDLTVEPDGAGAAGEATRAVRLVGTGEGTRDCPYTIADLCALELSTAGSKASFSLPANAGHFRKCLLMEGVPSTYLYTKGLRRVSAGLWMDGFDISSVEPTVWGSIEI